MTPRIAKILTVSLVVGGLIHFAPQEIKYGAPAAHFVWRLGWATRTPYWGFVQVGVLSSLDIWLMGIAALASGLAGGVISEQVCVVGALSPRLGYRHTALFALIANVCFIWAPYQMGYLQIDKPKDLFSAGVLPYFVLAVFTVWLLFQNVLRFTAVDRTLRTSLVTFGSSLVSVIVSFPVFFYSLALGMTFHEMLWPARHFLE